VSTSSDISVAATNPTKVSYKREETKIDYRRKEKNIKRIKKLNIKSRERKYKQLLASRFVRIDLDICSWYL
jgi:hypothetical protein